jgi:hypothetical protein
MQPVRLKPFTKYPKRSMGRNTFARIMMLSTAERDGEQVGFSVRKKCFPPSKNCPLSTNLPTSKTSPLHKTPSLNKLPPIKKSDPFSARMFFTQLGPIFVEIAQQRVRTPAAVRLGIG